MNPLALIAVLVGGFVLLRAFGKRKDPTAPTVTTTPAGGETAIGLGEQSSGQDQILGAALATGGKFGIFGMLAGFFVYAMTKALSNPESPDYESFGLPCRPDLAVWDEEGGCTIRVPDETHIDAVDVRLPPAWIAAAFPGNPELVGVKESGMFAWNPGALNPVQDALRAACPWLATYEGIHFAGYGPYTVPGWGKSPFPEEIAWIRLRHSHPWNYNGEHNVAQLIIQTRRLAYFWARDRSDFANWLRAWVVEKRRVEQGWWAIQALGDACHRLGITWGTYSRNYVEDELGLNPGNPGRSDGAAWVLLTKGPQSEWASYDEKNHATTAIPPNPSRGWERAWAIAVAP